MPDVKCVLIHDNFQNFKSYNIPKAQLVIADIPYNIGTDFYASRPDWYVDGDNKNGESSKARKAAFNTDFTFNIAEYFHFCNRLLKKEPGTADPKGDHRSREIRLQELYPAGVLQELQSAGVKSQHENCGRNGVCAGFVPGQAPEVP